MDTIYLVACVSMKRSEATVARDLYCSPWFCAARRYVGAREWLILSAKHLLVSPDQVLAPYNTTLHDMSAGDRRDWGAQVATMLPRGKHYVFLAGKMYWEPIAPHIESYEAPLKGLGIGQQLSWLKARAMYGDANGEKLHSLSCA